MGNVVSEICTVLNDAGLHTTEAFSLPKLPRLEEPMLAVYAEEIEQLSTLLGDYLYTDTDEVEHFGRQTTYVVRLECYFPYGSSGSNCPAYLERVIAVLQTAQLTKQLQVGAVTYDPVSDCFRCTLRMRVRVIQEAEVT